MEAYDEDGAKTGAREWWEERIKTSRTYIWGSLGGAIAYFIAGAIFLGLTRVTRWIVTGR